MDKSPIIKLYLRAKEAGLLTYFVEKENGLHNGLIKNCLIDFIDSAEFKPADERTILKYFKNEFKTIKWKINEDGKKELGVYYECKPADFGPIKDLIDKDRSSNRYGTIELAEILLRFDIAKGEKIKEIISSLDSYAARTLDFVMIMNDWQSTVLEQKIWEPVRF